jgi:hypothetical protein
MDPLCGEKDLDEKRREGTTLNKMRLPRISS